MLIAAASWHEDAFHCLMKYVDLDDPKKNPIFLAFQAQYKKMAILQVAIVCNVKKLHVICCINSLYIYEYILDFPVHDQ